MWCDVRSWRYRDIFHRVKLDLGCRNLKRRHTTDFSLSDARGNTQYLSYLDRNGRVITWRPFFPPPPPVNDHDGWSHSHAPLWGHTPIHSLHIHPFLLNGYGQPSLKPPRRAKRMKKISVHTNVNPWQSANLKLLQFRFRLRNCSLWGFWGGRWGDADELLHPRGTTPGKPRGSPFDLGPSSWELHSIIGSHTILPG